MRERRRVGWSDEPPAAAVVAAVAAACLGWTLLHLLRQKRMRAVCVRAHSGSGSHAAIEGMHGQLLEPLGDVHQLLQDGARCDCSL